MSTAKYWGLLGGVGRSSDNLGMRSFLKFLNKAFLLNPLVAHTTLYTSLEGVQGASRVKKNKRPRHKYQMKVYFASPLANTNDLPRSSDGSPGVVLGAGAVVGQVSRCSNKDENVNSSTLTSSKS